MTKCPKCNTVMRLYGQKVDVEKWVCPNCKHKMTIYTSKELKLGDVHVKSDKKYWL